MIGAREDIHAALFALLSTTPGFASYWRRWLPIEQLKTAQKPALMMRAITEAASAYIGMPDKYHMIFEVCIVLQTPISPLDAIPSASINPLIDAVETILMPDISGRLTLGLPNVSRVWIEGQIEILEAISDDVSYVKIPINVVAV